ncbi:MAG: hypothetical protein GX209_09690 [Epulopiscium sp.]|nr:hypothetical protein [Candidatus Epulonipiscium sp.]
MSNLNFKTNDESEDIFILNLDEQLTNEETGLSFGFQDKTEEQFEIDAQQDLINQVLKDIKAAEAGIGLEEASDQAKQMRQKFEQKQIEFLSGKVVQKDIVEDGDMIARIGDTITPHLIKNAREHGRLIELIMNCK